MYSYDKPLTLQYNFAQMDFGASNVVRRIAVPVIENGRRPAGRVVGAIVSNITEAFAGTTSDGSIQVGTAENPDAYFESRALDEGDDPLESMFLTNVDPDAIDIERNRDDIQITFVASVGTPTGIADVSLIINWF